MPQTLDGVARCLNKLVGDEYDGDLQACLKLGDIRTLLVEQEARHLDGHLHMHGCGSFLHGFFLQNAQDM
jgi:hypothetical protein